MSDVQACLSVFAVASWANNTQSLTQAESAIDTYVEKFQASDKLQALLTLQESFSRMPLDSKVAVSIRRNIVARIAALASPNQDPSIYIRAHSSEVRTRD
ncbi:MAG TPA: hypothetical protein PKE16_20325 [Hyphomicrobium sp.]|nr:hypothetical protein [Hyphomicrobium sp.]